MRDEGGRMACCLLIKQVALSVKQFMLHDRGRDLLQIDGFFVMEPLRRDFFENNKVQARYMLLS